MKFQKRSVKKYLIPSLLLLLSATAYGQRIMRYEDSLVVSTGGSSVSVNNKTGRLNYHFGNGVVLNNTIAYVNELSAGYIPTSVCKTHQITAEEFSNDGGKGVRIVISHSGNDAGITLVQQVLLYQDHPYLLVNLTA